MHLDGPARVFEALAVAKGVIEENLVFTHVHSNRRESGQIAIQRRRPRVARVVRTEIESRRGSEGVLSQEWVRFIPCFHTGARKRQVGPGRHDRRTDGRSSRAFQRSTTSDDSSTSARPPPEESPASAIFAKPFLTRPL